MHFLARSSPRRLAPADFARTTGHVRIAAVDGRSEWNALVLRLGDADLHQGFEWGELHRAIGSRVLRRAVYDGDAPVAALSATVWRPLPSPFGLLYASRGPVLGTASAPLLASGLAAMARAMARETPAVALRCSPGASTREPALHAGLLRAGFVHLPDEWTVWNAPRVSMVLDLRPDEARLRRAMRESTRLALTRVQKQGGRVDLDASLDAVARLHRLLVAAGRRRAYPVRDLGFFRALHREYLSRGLGCVALASHGGRDLAGALVVRLGPRAHLLYAAVAADHEPARKLRAGTAVHWALIRWAKAAGCEVLDWGGAMTRFPPCEGNPGYGIYDFKRGFGCSLVRHPGYYDLVFRPALYRAFRYAETRWAPALWRLRGRMNS